MALEGWRRPTGAAAVATFDSFAQLRAEALGGDAKATEALPVLEAVQDIISQRKKEAGGGGGLRGATATEYALGLLSMLGGECQTHTLQCLVLLEYVLPHAKAAMLQGSFVPVASALARVLKANADGDDDALLGRLLHCLGLVLAAQGQSASAWANPAVLRVFHTLLNFFNDRRTQVRRGAHEGVLEVLKNKQGGGGGGAVGAGKPKKTRKGAPKDAPAHVAEFCIAVMKDCTGQDSMKAMHLLQFMREAVPLLPQAQASSVSSQMLRLPSLAVPALTSATMQCLSGVLQSPSQALSAEAQSELLIGLMDVQPNRTNVSGAISFSQLLGSAMVTLHMRSHQASARLLSPCTQSLVGYLESSSTQVHQAAVGSLNLMFQTCVGDDLVKELAKNKARAEGGGGGGGGGGVGKPCVLETVLCGLEGLLQYRYQQSWTRSLPLLGRLFRHLRGNAFPALASTLQGLGDLHDALSSVPQASLPGVMAALDEAVGLAVEGVGPEKVLQVLSLCPRGTPATQGVADSRAWLLPLLKQHSKACSVSLAFFQASILGTARACDAIVKSGKCTANEAKDQKVRVAQLWALFPSVCHSPTDVATSFGKLAPLLANAMADERYPELVAVICEGLSVLVDGIREEAGGGTGGVGEELLGDEASSAPSSTPSALKMVSVTSTRFLPKLLQVLEAHAAGPTPQSQEAQAAKAVCKAVASFAAVAPLPFLQQMFKKLVQKLLQASEAYTLSMQSKNTKTKSLKQCGASVGSSTHTEGQAAVDEERGRAAALEGKVMVLLEAAAGITPSLYEDGATLLYRVTKPLIRDDSSALLQKKAYRALLSLLQSQGKALLVGGGAKDVLDLLATSLPTCHTTARPLRLRCLRILVWTWERKHAASSSGGVSGRGGASGRTNGGALKGQLHEDDDVEEGDEEEEEEEEEGDEDDDDLDAEEQKDFAGAYVEVDEAFETAMEQAKPSVIGEAVLCTKDPSRRTRSLAFSLLVLLARAQPPGNKPELLVLAVVAGLAGATPHMRSATLLALARLHFEFAHFRSPHVSPAVVALGPDLIRTVLLLLQEPHREVVKASLDLLRVVVGGGDINMLSPLVPDIIKGMMVQCPSDMRQKFRGKIKVVLSKLCRKFGFEAIKTLVPPDDLKLLTHMQKMATRELKAKKDKGVASAIAAEQNEALRGGHSHTGQQGGEVKALRSFDAIMADDGGGEEGDAHPQQLVVQQRQEQRQRRRGEKEERGGGGGGGAQAVLAGGMVDLLDGSMIRNMRVVDKDGHGAGNDSGSEDDGMELEVGKDGKLIIPGGYGVGDDESSSDDDDDGSGGGGGKGGGGSKGGQRRKRKRSAMDDENDDDDDDAADATGGKGKRKGVRAGSVNAPAAPTSAAPTGWGNAGERQNARNQHAQHPSSKRARRGEGGGGGGGGGAGGKGSGAEYRSNRAGGDVKKKGQKLEPYAYIPLDGRSLTLAANAKKAGKGGKKSKGGKARGGGGKGGGGEGSAQDIYDAVVGAGARKKGYRKRQM